MLGLKLKKSNIFSYLTKRTVTSLDQIKTIGVVGSGQMGVGISYVFARYNTNITKSRKI